MSHKALGEINPFDREAYFPDAATQVSYGDIDPNDREPLKVFMTQFYASLGGDDESIAIIRQDNVDTNKAQQKAYGYLLQELSERFHLDVAREFELTERRDLPDVTIDAGDRETMYFNPSNTTEKNLGHYAYVSLCDMRTKRSVLLHQIQVPYSLSWPDGRVEERTMRRLRFTSQSEA